MKAPKNSSNRLDNHNKDTENRLIFKALRNCNVPLTRRQLSGITNLEIATLCRALYNLCYRNKTVIIAKYDRCKTTGKLVMHFALSKKGAYSNG